MIFASFSLLALPSVSCQAGVYRKAWFLPGLPGWMCTSTGMFITGCGQVQATPKSHQACLASVDHCHHCFCYLQCLPPTVYPTNQKHWGKNYFFKVLQVTLRQQERGSLFGSFGLVAQSEKRMLWNHWPAFYCVLQRKHSDQFDQRSIIPSLGKYISVKGKRKLTNQKSVKNELSTRIIIPIIIKLTFIDHIICQTLYLHYNF